MSRATVGAPAAQRQVVMPTDAARRRSAAGIACVGLSLVLAGCLGSSDEVARVTSPSGKLDAVLVERNGGATTDFEYEVFVVPVRESTSRYKRVAFFYGAVRSERAYGVNLRWVTPSNLALEYLRARHEDLTLSSVAVAGECVSPSLRNGVSDPKAPPGGMLYNLQGRPDDR